MTVIAHRILDTKLTKTWTAAGRWLCLLATADIVSKTGPRERRAKLMNRMN